MGKKASVSWRWVRKVKTTGRFVYNINNLRRENNLKREFLFLLEPIPLLACFYTETVCMYKPLSPRFKKREKINDRGKTEGEGIAGKEEISRFQCNTNGPIQDVGMLPESQAAFTLLARYRKGSTPTKGYKTEDLALMLPRKISMKRRLAHQVEMNSFSFTESTLDCLSYEWIYVLLVKSNRWLT